MTRRRTPIAPREPFTVDDPRTFQHTDADCPCKPRTIVVNPSGLRLVALIHYPATRRGRIKRATLVKRTNRRTTT